jgi:hypothetical protein
MKLFKPAWESKNYTIAKKAFEKVKKQKTFAKIAQSIRVDRSIRINSIEKLEKQSHQALLTDIAKNDWDNQIRIAAACKLTDSEIRNSVLADVLLKSKEFFLRRDALEKLDVGFASALLIDLLKTDKDISFRCAVLLKLTDQSQITQIALNSKINSLINTSLDKVTNKDLLVKIRDNLDIYDSRGAFIDSCKKLIQLLGRDQIPDSLYSKYIEAEKDEERDNLYDRYVRGQNCG